MTTTNAAFTIPQLPTKQEVLKRLYQALLESELPQIQNGFRIPEIESWAIEKWAHATRTLGQATMSCINLLSTRLEQPNTDVLEESAYHISIRFRLPESVSKLFGHSFFVITFVQNLQKAWMVSHGKPLLPKGRLP